MEIIELVKKILKKTGNLDKYVILRKDDEGFYIEYAFQPGAPHDNRCLSWYTSYQEKAYQDCGWFDGKDKRLVEGFKKKLLNERLDRVGKIYELFSFTCGYENNKQEEDTKCRVGCPNKECMKDMPWWTYKEPRKCACWHLDWKEIKPETLVFSLSASEILDLFNSTV